MNLVLVGSIKIKKKCVTFITDVYYPHIKFKTHRLIFF